MKFTILVDLLGIYYRRSLPRIREDYFNSNTTILHFLPVNYLHLFLHDKCYIPNFVEVSDPYCPIFAIVRKIIFKRRFTKACSFEYYFKARFPWFQTIRKNQVWVISPCWKIEISRTKKVPFKRSFYYIISKDETFF